MVFWIEYKLTPYNKCSSAHLYLCVNFNCYFSIQKKQDSAATDTALSPPEKCKSQVLIEVFCIQSRKGMWLLISFIQLEITNSSQCRFTKFIAIPSDYKTLIPT